jgi:hypothetical protein
MAHDVFISYSSVDKPIADAICARLEDATIRCWIAPRDILPGQEYAPAILAAIESSRVLVLVLSTNANTSPHISREVDRAVRHGAAILPFRVEVVDPSGTLEYLISTTHWLDAITPPLEQHLDRLTQAVHVLLGNEAGGGAIVPPRRAQGPEAHVNSAIHSKAQPVLGFEYDSARGWTLKNIGDGPALEIIVAQRGKDQTWQSPVRVPPLGAGERFVLSWLGHANVDVLGATFRDLAGADYTAVCQDDASRIESGNRMGNWAEAAISRHWNAGGSTAR